jgi:hypothetical protein
MVSRHDLGANHQVEFVDVAPVGCFDDGNSEWHLLV